MLLGLLVASLICMLKTLYNSLSFFSFARMTVVSIVHIKLCDCLNADSFVHDLLVLCHGSVLIHLKYILHAHLFTMTPY